MRRRFSNFLDSHNFTIGSLPFSEGGVTMHASLKDVGQEKYTKRACIPQFSGVLLRVDSKARVGPASNVVVVRMKPQLHHRLAAIFRGVTMHASLKDVGQEKYAKRACIPMTVFRCSPSRRLESASGTSIERSGGENEGEENDARLLLL
ncbi:hypothetical protein Aduo_015099 [Ancylostoma duodenale]